MRLKDFKDELDWPSLDKVSFVGIKWQDYNHPSAEEFPIDFVSCEANGETLKVKFVTKPKHP